MTNKDKAVWIFVHVDVYDDENSQQKNDSTFCVFEKEHKTRQYFAAFF